MQIHAGQLRFGIHAGQQYASFDDYLEIWRTAEEVGLDWASVFDHFMPIQADPTGPCFDGPTLLSAMAAHTSRMAIGIIVTSVTYRPPWLAAKIAATIDQVSGGRLEWGIGAGWYELEHDQYGIDFPRIGVRMDMLEEACACMRGLWDEREFSFSGKHYTLTDAMSEPKPVQERLPLWIGGSGEKRTLRIVAEHADGWNTFFGTPEELDHKLGVLAQHCADVGRDPEDIRKQLVARAVLRDTEAEAVEALRERGVNPEGFFAGTPEQFVERCRPMIDRGVGDILLMGRPPLDRPTLERLAGVVAPALRAG